MYKCIYFKSFSCMAIISDKWWTGTIRCLSAFQMEFCPEVICLMKNNPIKRGLINDLSWGKNNEGETAHQTVAVIKITSKKFNDFGCVQAKAKTECSPWSVDCPHTCRGRYTLRSSHSQNFSPLRLHDFSAAQVQGPCCRAPANRSLRNLTPGELLDSTIMLMSLYLNYARPP